MAMALALSCGRRQRGKKGGGGGGDCGGRHFHVHYHLPRRVCASSFVPNLLPRFFLAAVSLRAGSSCAVLGCACLPRLVSLVHLAVFLFAPCGTKTSTVRPSRGVATIMAAMLINALEKALQKKERQRRKL
ncbi:hypothetical protein EE612_028290 [Oryza sativa]|nr:hypothetical protein EE612_028290 [Oryza sativa]